MKPAGGAHVHVEIGVMHIVKAPEEGRQVHEHVPPVIGVIVKQHAGDHRERSMQTKPVEESESFPRRPEGDNKRDRYQEQTRKKKTGRGEDCIPQEAPERGKMLPPQRPLPLNDQERAKYDSEDEAEILDQRIVHS